MSNEQTMDKLRKILRLANNEGATQGEMEAAMQRAKEIALRYNIELADVDMGADQEAKQGINVGHDNSIKPSTNTERPYHPWILQALQACFDVRVITYVGGRGGRRKVTSICFIGEAMDLAIAKELFGWMEEMFPKTYRTAVNQGLVLNSRAAKHGFYRGLCEGIILTNKKAEANLSNADASKYAMVVSSKKDAIERMMKELFPDVKTRTHNPKADASAYHAGVEKGKNIRLGAQVGGGTSRSRLAN